MNSFGEYIRAARLKGDLSLREAARRIGVSPTYLSQIENGKVAPPMPAVLRNMAGLYSVSFDNLIQRAQNRLSESVGRDAADDRVVAALLRKVLDLDAEVRVEALRAVVKQYAQLSDVELDQLIRKMTVDLKRLSRGREGLFAADVVPRRLSRNWIERKASRFLASHGIQEDDYHPPTNIDMLIEKHPQLCLVVDDALDDDSASKPRILGVSHWDTDGERRVIKANPKLVNDPSATAEHRYRFTLGHELFHALEHLPLMDERFKVRGACLREAVLLEAGLISIDLEQIRVALESIPKGPTWWLRQRPGPKPLCSNEDWREWQANAFSSAILMPEWSVQSQFAIRFGSEPIRAKDDPRASAWEHAEAAFSEHAVFEPMHEVYNVSKQAMAIRLMQLGLVIE